MWMWNPSSYAGHFNGLILIFVLHHFLRPSTRCLKCKSWDRTSLCFNTLQERGSTQLCADWPVSYNSQVLGTGGVGSLASPQGLLNGCRISWLIRGALIPPRPPRCHLSLSLQKSQPYSDTGPTSTQPKLQNPMSSAQRLPGLSLALRLTPLREKITAWSSFPRELHF